MPRLWKRERILGEGGFGVVSLASTSPVQPVIEGFQLPPLIAVKTCELSRSQSLQEERGFLRLFQDCPYIVRCFRVNISEENDMTLYNLLLEYASGGSLADRLSCYSGKGMPEFEVRKHVKNILLGLIEVHDRGVVHCDIKPHNILLVGSDEVAKIADLGLAMTLEQSRRENLGLRGTISYMAPESVANEEYGTEVDIWALGCTVYELITGKPLWESDSDTDDDVLDKIVFEEPDFESAKLSDEALDFLKKCLIKNPGSRWSAQMLLTHAFVSSSKLADKVLLVNAWVEAVGGAKKGKNLWTW